MCRRLPALHPVVFPTSFQSIFYSSFDLLHKAFQPSPCLHTGAAPTLRLSDRDPSIHHTQTNVHTLASLSLAQRIVSLLGAVSSFRMTVLTAGSLSGLGQRMVSAAWPLLPGLARAHF